MTHWEAKDGQRWSVCPKTDSKTFDPITDPQKVIDGKSEDEEDCEEPPSFIVITSEDGGAEFSGFCLGEYTLVDVDLMTSVQGHQELSRAIIH